MKDKVFYELKPIVREFLEKDSSGHDYYHAERVFNSALTLQKKEGGNIVVIGSAALMHDICRPWEKKTGKLHYGEEALEIIAKELRKTSITKSDLNLALEVIRYHDIYDWTKKMNNKSIELQIVQDADNLDAIGAIGIARTFAFAGSHGLDMYIPGEDLDFTEDFVEDPNHRRSTIAHFYEKLLKLKENMNTKSGQKLAKGRHKVMERFLEEFFDEWEGRK
jgi:uncharacterized protein